MPRRRSPNYKPDRWKNFMRWAKKISEDVSELIVRLVLLFLLIIGVIFTARAAWAHLWPANQAESGQKTGIKQKQHQFGGRRGLQTGDDETVSDD